MKEIIVVMITLWDGTNLKRESILQQNFWNTPQFSTMTCKGYTDELNRQLDADSKFIGVNFIKNRTFASRIRYSCQKK